MAGCKPNCCTQPRAAPWGNDVALIKVSRSVRATCFMRGNAPCGVKGIMGYALSARGIFAPAQNAECINRGLRSPGRCPGLWATFGLTARPNHLLDVCAIDFIYMHLFLTFSTALGIARTSSALHSLEQTFAYSLDCEPKNL